MDHGVNVPFRMYATHFGNLLGDGETQLVTWYGCLVIYPDADLGSARPNSWLEFEFELGRSYSEFSDFQALLWMVGFDGELGTGTSSTSRPRHWAPL